LGDYRFGLGLGRIRRRFSRVNRRLSWKALKLLLLNLKIELFYSSVSGLVRFKLGLFSCLRLV
jgi:hypothetical protein